MGRALSYLPKNASELPPVVATDDPPDRRLDEVLDVVPRDPRKAYDMHRVLDLVADRGSVLELKAEYDASLITALGRLDGHSVGFFANNPRVSVGADDPKAARRQLVEELQHQSEPWEAAGLNLVDDVIDPRDTRRELIRALRRARGPAGNGGRSQRLLASWPTMF